MLLALLLSKSGQSFFHSSADDVSRVSPEIEFTYTALCLLATQYLGYPQPERQPDRCPLNQQLIGLNNINIHFKMGIDMTVIVEQLSGERT